MNRFAYTVFGFILAVTTFMPAHADEISKNAKLHELASLRGVRKILEIQNEISAKTSKDTSDKMIAQLFGKTNVPDDKRKKFIEITERYMEKATKPIDYREAENSWCSYYGKNIEEADLDKIITFYRTPVGQKDAQAELNLQSDWTAELRRKKTEIVEKAMTSYMEELKAAMAEIPPQNK